MFVLAPHIGHRGVAALAAENSIAGIRACARHFCFAEVDARPSYDGAAVLSHDDSLRRCLQDPRRVSRLRAAAAVAAGAPRLTTALALARRLRLGLVVEIKANQGEDAKAAAATAAALQTAGAAGVCVSSFSFAALQHLRAQTRQSLPRLPLALNLNRPAPNWRRLCRALGAQNVHINHLHFAAADIRAFKRAGLGVYCFTVNNAARQAQLFAQGADGVFTDFPPPTPATAKAPRRQARQRQTGRRQSAAGCRQ